MRCSHALCAPGSYLPFADPYDASEFDCPASFAPALPPQTDTASDFYAFLDAVWGPHAALECTACPNAPSKPEVITCCYIPTIRDTHTHLIKTRAAPL